MTEAPDPYTDGEAWDPDLPADNRVRSTRERLEYANSGAETYYEVLGLERTEDISNATIKQAFHERLLETRGDGDEAGARAKTRILLEARDALRRHGSEYYRMVSKLGPRLGHQAFIQWRIIGGSSDVARWIRKYKPENQSFRDGGFE